MRSLLLSVALVACVARPPPPSLPYPLIVCPASPASPVSLPAVVDAHSLALAYRQSEAARLAERRRGDLCADSLQRMGDWMQSHE